MTHTTMLYEIYVLRYTVEMFIGVYFVYEKIS